jgi:hypothetical protein
VTIAAKIKTDAYILKRPGFDVGTENADYSHEWPNNLHVGFELPTVGDVRELYDRFNADGIEMETEAIHEAGTAKIDPHRKTGSGILERRVSQGGGADPCECPSQTEQRHHHLEWQMRSSPCRPGSGRRW